MLQSYQKLSTMVVKAVHGTRRACTITLTLTTTVHGGSHCAVAKEAKCATHIDNKNLPWALAGF